MDKKKNIGKMLWHDLTVNNAEAIRDFYCKVVGWTFSEHPMGEYSDYNIIAPDGETVTGICHAKGVNKNIPPQWINYVGVEDLETSMKACTGLGGKILDGPRTMGASKYAIIQDPAGAVIALFQEY